MSAAAMEFTVRLTMRSDWSVSSGSGRQGALDSLVERDAARLPYVPATTLRGMWRDAAEQVAFGLDNGARGAWCELVDHLFGSQPAGDRRGETGNAPIPGRLSLADVRFAQSFRDALRGKDQRLRDALVLVKPGVKIEQRSGRAQNEYLRFEEVARQGALLEARAAIALSGHGKFDEALVCLAFAASRLVERIGGNRRRGSGCCVMEIAAAPVDGLPESVEAAVERIGTATPADPAFAPRAAAPIAFAPAADEAMIAIPLDIEVLTPTVVARAVLGNVVTTFDNIPGTLMLAGVARMLTRAGLDEQIVKAAFACGDIRVLPAYPVIERQRGWPVPLGSDLGKTHIRYVVLSENAGAGPNFVFRNPKLATRTHNTVEDARQKPTEDVGGVFSYQALGAGERLKSEIRLREGLAARLNASLGEETITIGRARKAGYGAVRLVAGESQPHNSAHRASTEITLYLASDVLLPPLPVTAKDASPRAFLAAAIAAVTGRAVGVEGSVRTHRTDGWVASWGLPRPSYVAICAGSVVRVESSDSQPFSSEQLDRLEREGIGQRRGEGFGHVMVEPEFVRKFLEEKTLPSEVGESAPPPAAATLPSELREFAILVETAALHDAIALKAEHSAHEHRSDKLRWTDQQPNMSQLGALRSAMARLENGHDLTRARSFVARVMETDRRRKWGDDNVNERHPLKILERLFGEPDSVWSCIGFDDLAEWQQLLAHRQPSEARGNAALQRFAIASFLFAAMRAHKRAIEGPSIPTGAA